MPQDRGQRADSGDTDFVCVFPLVMAALDFTPKAFSPGGDAGKRQDLTPPIVCVASGVLIQKR